jgi:uncharacterized protein YcaQ
VPRQREAGPSATRPRLRLRAGQARLLQLAAQGLLAPPRRRARRADLLAAVERMQVLQIDTIHVVARSPYLTLFSRVGPYPPEWLDELLAEGALFECWSHEACFAPIADYALHRAHQLARSGHWAMRSAARSRAAHDGPMEALLARVRAEGPLRASDFERPAGMRSGWWGWKQEKRWLEAWFALGELMVARRERFERVYDVRERVLARARPAALAAETPSPEAARLALVLRAVRALGVAPARHVADYFRLGRRVEEAELAPLVASGELVEASVEGFGAPGYVHRDLLPLARRAARGALRATYTTLLSPFDPLVWDRARASSLFAFDYRLECYTPAPRRRYGYYALPILDRGRLVGRADAKAHRADGLFEVKALYLEPGVAPSEARVAAIAGALARCAHWHGTPRVVVRRSRPGALARALGRRLRGG